MALVLDRLSRDVLRVDSKQMRQGLGRIWLNHDQKNYKSQRRFTAGIQTFSVMVEVRDSPNGIFGSWARWNRAPPDVQSSWETAVVAAAAAVVVSWKFRWTFRPGNYDKTSS